VRVEPIHGQSKSCQRAKPARATAYIDLAARCAEVVMPGATAASSALSFIPLGRFTQEIVVL